MRKHLEAAGKTAEVLEKEEREQAKKGPIEVGEWINERVKKIFTPVNNYVSWFAGVFGSRAMIFELNSYWFR